MQRNNVVRRTAVIQILDSSSNVVVEYEYCPWGEARNITGSMAWTIGEENPFRYRGYYYDSESGLYYLNARYYDPVTHRFINSDNLLATNSDFASYNLFSYCSNNPIIFSDCTGDFAEAIIGGILDWILGLFGVSTAGAAAASTTPAPMELGPIDKAIIGVVFPPVGAYFVGEAVADYVENKRTQYILAVENFNLTLAAEQDRLRNDNSTAYYSTAYYDKASKKIVTGQPVTYAQARASLEGRSKQSFMAKNRSYALALVAGIELEDGKRAIYEIDRGKENTPGFYFHFHTSEKHGDPHVWHYGPPFFPDQWKLLP